MTDNSFTWEEDDLKPRRPGWLTWLIVLLLVCTLLLPSLSPFLRAVYRTIQPTPTPTLAPNTVALPGEGHS
jgi:hypothetical protein